MTAFGWQADALCRQIDSDLWFPHENDSRFGLVAKRICAGCPVLAQCRAWGLSDDAPEFGILGGLSARARRAMRARARRQVAA